MHKTCIKNGNDEITGLSDCRSIRYAFGRLSIVAHGLPLVLFPTFSVNKSSQRCDAIGFEQDRFSVDLYYIESSDDITHFMCFPHSTHHNRGRSGG